MKKLLIEPKGVLEYAVEVSSSKILKLSCISNKWIDGLSREGLTTSSFLLEEKPRIWRPWTQAEDYESLYVFCDKFTDDLKLGAEILEAHILLYEDKKEMEFLSPVRDRVLKEGDVRKVRFEETKALHLLTGSFTDHWNTWYRSGFKLSKIEWLKRRGSK